jgi:hypothetical protein
MSHTLDKERETGMLLSPSENLSHTSILYYILYGELEYNFLKNICGLENIIHKAQSEYSLWLYTRVRNAVN